MSAVSQVSYSIGKAFNNMRDCICLTQTDHRASCPKESLVPMLSRCVALGKF